MSFICQGCNEAQPTGVGPIRTITQIRTLGGNEYDKAREEIAEEKNLCSPCAEPYKEAAAEKEKLRYGTGLASTMVTHIKQAETVDAAMSQFITPNRV